MTPAGSQRATCCSLARSSGWRWSRGSRERGLVIGKTGRSPSWRPARWQSNRLALRRLPKLHASVHGLQANATTAFADRGAHAARVHSALQRDREVGRQASVYGAHVEIGVEVPWDLDL